VSQIPANLRKNRLLFSTVRDPWAWYTSLYQHALTADDQAPLLAFGSGKSDFRSVLWGMTHPWGVDLHEDFAMVMPFQGDHRESFKQKHVGLYTWLNHWIHGEPGAKGSIRCFIDTPQLNEGLAQLLDVHSITEKPQNAAAHRPKTHIKNPKSLWDVEMIEWVRQADPSYIELFGYDGPFTQTLKAITLLQERHYDHH
tara:strand:+ start:133 stop:726 length:594 start_codon:yes stop_codon:yes gene_type:complete